LQINHETDFVAEGCKIKGQSAITYGAGTQFQDIYDFAEEHNLLIVGGSDQSVGAAGGWAQVHHFTVRPTLRILIRFLYFFRVVDTPQ